MLTKVSNVALPNLRMAKVNSYYSNLLRLLQPPKPLPAKHKASHMSCPELQEPSEDEADPLLPLNSGVAVSTVTLSNWFQAVRNPASVFVTALKTPM